MIRVMQSRINSMALIHNHFYQSDNVSSIDMGNYIHALGIHLLVLYRIESKKIDIEYDVKNIKMDINKAIPFGLIANELISNCFKHAFPDDFLKGKPEKYVPTISIDLKREESGPIHLRISDNGVGYSENQGLGLVLVNDLVGQIDGTLERKTDQGTLYEICFSSD